MQGSLGLSIRVQLKRWSVTRCSPPLVSLESIRFAVSPSATSARRASLSSAPTSLPLVSHSRSQHRNQANQIFELAPLITPTSSTQSKAHARAPSQHPQSPKHLYPSRPSCQSNLKPCYNVSQKHSKHSRCPSFLSPSSLSPSSSNTQRPHIPRVPFRVLTTLLVPFSPRSHSRNGSQCYDLLKNSLTFNEFLVLPISE